MTDFIPAAGRHAFTPLFDAVAALFGVGAGFKGRVAEAAGLADGAPGFFYLVDMGPRRRRLLTAEQEGSFKHAFRGNSAAAIGDLLTEAGFTVTKEKPPWGGLLSPWLFAFRSVRRD